MMKVQLVITNVALVAILLFQLSNAADHIVGAPDGSWDLVTDFKAWSSSNKFFTGDKLTFKYIPEVHDVFEVTKSNYDKCSGMSPISSDASGHTVIKLDSSGKRYFICAIPGHCQSGMKVEVNVLPSSSSSSSPPPKSTPPPSPLVKSPPPSASPPASPPPSSSPPPPSKTSVPPPSSSPPPPSKTSSPPPSSSPPPPSKTSSPPTPPSPISTGTPPPSKPSSASTTSSCFHLVIIAGLVVAFTIMVQLS